MRTCGIALGAFVVMTAWTTLAGQQQPAAKPPAQHSTATSTARVHPMTTDPELLHPAKLVAKAPELFDVKLETTKGEIVVHVTRAWAPLGADRFYNLVKHGFYNGAPFFRVVPGFVVQFGLSGDPAVNRVWQNANIKADKVTQSNRLGTLVFATAGPHTRTTQLFINLANNASLDSQGFAPFGEVSSGMDIVQKIYSGYGERPDQGAIGSQGRAYIEKNFPNIDGIKTATVVAPPHQQPK
jgi:peptidyl-prolyl cis-trans isomerase A (cyclophilin A)